MEAVAEHAPEPQAQQHRATGHLRVVGDAPKFSALPHAVLFDKRVSRDARLLYAVLQAHWWKTGECYAGNATLADEMGCSDSQLRRYLGELVRAGWIIGRRAGRGQAKAYAPTQQPSDGDAQPLTGERFNCSPVSGSDANRSPVAPQPFTGGGLEAPNRSPVDAPYKKTPVKKTPEDKSIHTDSAVEREIFEYFRSRIQPTARLCPTEKIRARLKTFGPDELKRGIDNFAADGWSMENNGRRGADWFFHSDQRSERYLNMVPRPTKSNGKPAPAAPRPGSLAARTKSERFGG